MAYADKIVYQNKDRDILWTWKILMHSQDIHSMFKRHRGLY